MRQTEGYAPVGYKDLIRGDFYRVPSRVWVRKSRGNPNYWEWGEKERCLGSCGSFERAIEIAHERATREQDYFKKFLQARGRPWMKYPPDAKTKI